MTKVLTRTEFEEIRAESLQIEEYHENTDGFDRIAKYRHQFSHNYRREVQLRPGLRLEILDEKYHNSDEMDLSLERLFSQLQGEKILNAIAVTPNQAGPQNQIKEKASAVCLISNSQCFCHRLVWYFGKQRHRFYSRFEPLGLAFLFGDEEVQV